MGKSQVQTRTQTQEVGSVIQLGQIETQGQYVNRANGQLFIADEQVVHALNVGGSLLERFISADPASLEYVLVSRDPHQPFDETRIEAAKLNLPVNF